EDRARIGRWLQILSALARAQAEVGLIPARAAVDIAALDAGAIDLEEVGRRTRATSHSTLGFIQVVQALLPTESREHVYWGATVQDVTDTSLALEIGAVGRWLLDDLL